MKDENGDIHSGEIVARKNNFDIIDCHCAVSNTFLFHRDKWMLTTKISITTRSKSRLC